MKNASTMQIFSDNVREFIQLHGWSIKEAAEICGMKREALSRILNGHENVTLDRAGKIASALGAKLGDLVEGEAVAN